jgi:hypothetical protein
MYSVPDLVLDGSQILNVPHSDLRGRVRKAREEKLVSQKFYGRGGALAVPRDGAAVILAPFVGKLWQDVPDGIRRYGGLKLRAARSIQAMGGVCEPPLDLRCEETTLLDALTTCLERCSVRSGYLPASLRIELSDIYPSASISLTTPSDTITLFFDDPSAKKGEREPYAISVEVRGETLCAFVDVFATKANKPVRRPAEGDQSDAAISAVA